MIGAQLPLAVQLRESASFDSYYAGPNAEPVAALQALAQPVLLYGPAGSGRTHLLQAAARRHRAAYLPLADVLAHGPEVLAGLEVAPAVCLDDLDAVLPQRDWCLALLRLIDQLRTRRAPHALAAGAPPERLDIALPDLRTRLGACSLFGLRPLDDEDRRQLLRERARARGLEMPEEVSRWLLHRCERDTASLLAALERLDRAALSAKRRLTLPFVQSVLVS
ncbi:MAG TPA: DnaA regulatory inactivator Hda [Solimonas sp.]|nr:DnaA regulatory inactivator Hda [Solimonas sp.]